MKKEKQKGYKIMRYSKKKFKTWLEENLKDDGKGNIWMTHSFDAYCKDLERQKGEVGQRRYELRHIETASGNPEVYSY